MAKTKMLTEETLSSLNRGDTVTVESQIGMSDVNMYKHLFEGAPMGMYKLKYVCPHYTMTLTVSWDGERLV